MNRYLKASLKLVESIGSLRASSFSDFLILATTFTSPRYDTSALASSMELTSSLQLIASTRSTGRAGFSPPISSCMKLYSACCRMMPWFLDFSVTFHPVRWPSASFSMAFLISVARSLCCLA